LAEPLALLRLPSTGQPGVMTGWRLLGGSDADVGAALLGAARQVCDEAFAGGFSDDDWQHTQGGWRVLVRTASTVLAHAAVVPRRIELDGRDLRAGYLEGVAVRPSRQASGLGTAVVRAATDYVRREYQVGVLSTGEPGFYERLGWERWRGPSWVRDGPSLRRTPDEDDGLLVLRVGPSLRVPAGTSIVCDGRAGDDW
jgi:aminoglycoside 2'-N-acetyltransferase I